MKVSITNKSIKLSYIFGYPSQKHNIRYIFNGLCVSLSLSSYILDQEVVVQGKGFTDLGFYLKDM